MEDEFEFYCDENGIDSDFVNPGDVDEFNERDVRERMIDLGWVPEW